MDMDALNIYTSGYASELFAKDVNIENYKCVICQKILRDAIQIPDSDIPARACMKCYKVNVRDGICPIVGKTNIAYFPDKFADKEIAELKVICPNKGNGCIWNASLKFLNEHISLCQFQSSLCKQCKNVVILHEHENYCPETLVTCTSCSKLTRRKNYEVHMRLCQMRREQCDCGEILLWSEAPKNILEHSKHQEKCLFHYIGCENEKYHDDTGHNALLVSKIIELKQEFLTVEQNCNEKNVKIQLLENDVHEIHTGHCELKNQIDSLSATLNNISELTKSLQREAEKLREQFNQPQYSISGGGAVLKENVDDLKSKLGRTEDKNSELSKSADDINLKIQLQENKTTHGEIIWKIDNVAFRMGQAKSGKVTALHSVACFTKQYGYKYCIRLYLHGDGMGRATHVSIFFVVMKSEYDELLPWPMKKRVTFEMINLEHEEDSIIETFVSNPKSSSFQRPTKNMNVGSGCPTFISIEQFLNGGFIKDNCAFIRTTVKNI